MLKKKTQPHPPLTDEEIITVILPTINGQL